MLKSNFSPNTKRRTKEEKKSNDQPRKSSFKINLAEDEQNSNNSMNNSYQEDNSQVINIDFENNEFKVID